MDVLTDTEIRDICTDVPQSPQVILGTDGGMEDILMHGGMHGHMGGIWMYEQMYRCTQSDRHTKMPDSPYITAN